MAVNKNFVVKNGLEVNTKLILADANTNRVGVGSTAPRFELDVAGGIGATDLYVSGVGTFAKELNVGTDGSVLTVLGVGGYVGVGTADPVYLLDIRSPVSTGQTALYIQGDVQITGDLKADDISLDDATLSNLTVTEAFNVTSPGLSTFSGYVYIDNSLEISTDLNVIGLTTLGGYVDINDSVDVSGTLNVVGVSTLGGYVDINDSVDVSTDLNVVGLTTLGGYVDINDDLDISGTLNVGGATTLGGYVDINDSVDVSGTLNVVGVTTLAIVDINAGDIEVSNVDTTDLYVSGISTLGSVLVSSGIVTASSGIVTYYGDGSELLGVIGGIGIGTTGGTVGFGVTFLNFFGAGVSTTQYEPSVGIATIFFEGGGGGSISISTVAPTLPGPGDLWYSPDYGRTFIYYDETVVGYGTDAYWVDAAPFNIGYISTLDGPITINGNLNVIGIITAVSFVGDGSGLTGTGSTVFDDTNTNQEFFPLFTNITSGTITASGISTSKLTYNPFNGEMTAINFNSTSDQNLKSNVQTIENALNITNQLRGVSFDWKETGTKSYGVIAQELEKVLPELVKNGEVKSVNYNGLIGVLIESIKELKREVEILKSYK